MSGKLLWLLLLVFLAVVCGWGYHLWVGEKATVDKKMPRVFGKLAERASRAEQEAAPAGSTIAGVITTEPRLPPIVVEYTVEDCVMVGPLNFSATITYSDHGRNDRIGPVTGSIPATGKSIRVPIDFGSQVQGGSFRVDGNVMVKDFFGQVSSLNLPTDPSLVVVGANPTKKDIKDRLGSLELQVIAYKETRFRQFDIHGNPVFGPPHGFGIMQLDNPRPSARQLWDWKANVDGGKDLYQKKVTEVNQHFTNQYQAHPEAPHLTPDQIGLSVYQYYNSGTFYWRWNAPAKKWEKAGTTVYADDARGIENLVKGGQPPSDWN